MSEEMKYKDFMAEYGDEKVKFSSYYKYSFTFKNDNLKVTVGGNADNIYRFDVSAEAEYSISELEPIAAFLPDGSCLGYWYY